MNRQLRRITRRIRDDWENAAPSIKRIAAAMLVACIHLVVFSQPAGQEIEEGLLRAWFSVRGEREVPRTVTVVRMDTAAYNRIDVPHGGLIPREYFGRAIRKIAAAGARAIVLDLYFIAKGEKVESDAELARALAESPSVIGRSMLVATYVDAQGKRTTKIEEKVPIKPFVNSAKLVLPMQVQKSDNGLVERIGLPPEAVLSLGVNVPLLKALRQFVEPTLTEPGELDYINFYGEPSSLTALSLADLMDDSRTPPVEYFKNRVVFIGLWTHAAPGVSGEDSFMTPASRDAEMFGVEIHATIAANLLDGTWIRRLPPSREAVVLGLLGFAIGLWLVSRKQWHAVALLCPVAGAWAVCSYLCFSRLFYFVPGVVLFCFVLPGAVLTRGLLVLGKAWIENREASSPKA